MKDDEMIKLAAAGFIALVVAPVVIGGVINIVSTAAVGIGNCINTAKYNRKIKKGLKDGSIVEINGQYYEVVVEDVEEA
jgi:hypothetical protein